MKQLVTKSNLDAVNDQLAEIQAKEKELLEQQAQLTKAYAEQYDLNISVPKIINATSQIEPSTSVLLDVPDNDDDSITLTKRQLPQLN